MIEQLSFAPSQAIENTLRFLRDSCPPEGYLISFSGGKDSLAVLEACKEAKVPYRYYYKITTVDPPELVKYIKRCHPECVRLPPPSGQSMYTMMGRKGLPTRTRRWCCAEFKEYAAPIERGRSVLLGVRAAESVARADNWGLVKSCGKIGGWKIAPILHWSDADVWEFLRARGAAWCELYDQGLPRLGCVGCPQDSFGRIDGLLRLPWTYCKYRDGAAKYVRNRRDNGVAFIAVWPGWIRLKTNLADLKDYGADDTEIDLIDAASRAEALAWQDAQDPQYLLRRIMAWWLEVPPDYWKLEQLEEYARSRAAKKEAE